jgi:ATPase subunit of ABC transporter with duplicated ATPase domains
VWYGERERKKELMQQNSQDPEGDATTVVHAVESLEQQLEDEQNSRPCSVALLGPNGAGKSFLINLLFQVTVGLFGLYSRSLLPLLSLPRHRLTLYRSRRAEGVIFRKCD